MDVQFQSSIDNNTKTLEIKDENKACLVNQRNDEINK